jgi:HAE1 family hydrophobic/amphiphilic exporter-1
VILSDVSIKRPVFATILNLVLIVFGIFSYTKLGIDQFPNVDFPVVVAQVTYPGADPKTIEQKVLDPLEKGLNGVEGLESLASTAFPNVGQIVLRFKLERNGDKAAQDVRDKISTIQGQLPTEAKAPVVTKFDVGGAPILILTLSSASDVPYTTLSRLAKDTVRPGLEQVQGVGRVDMVGLRQREIQVKLSRAAMQGYGLNPVQVAQSIQAQTAEVPSGKIENATEVTRIRTEGTAKSSQDVGKLVAGGRVRVEDVAQVTDGLADEEDYATYNGETAIVLSVYKQSGGNTVATADQTRAKMEDLTKSLPEGVKLQIVQDNSIYIKGSIDSVKFDLVLGAILAIVIVLVFLHDWRATVISAFAIPTSVIATFFFIQYMGFTLNLMTTLGLTLSIGILVDDAIVVIENIYSHIEKGESPMDAARNGAGEIGLAALAITLSIVAVFVPVAFMEGIIGRFFYQFGMTVAFAVLISLFVAFTLTPMMSSKLLRAHHGTPWIFKPVEFVLKGIENGYRNTLQLSLRFRWVTIALGIGVFIGSILMLGKVPFSFFPKEDRSMFSVNYQLKEGSSLTLMKSRAKNLDGLLRTYPGVQSVVMAIGANVERKPNLARFDVSLVAPEKRNFSQQDIINKMRDDLAKSFAVDGDTIEVLEQSGAGGKSQPIQIILTSMDAVKLTKFANEMKDYVSKSVDGAVDVTTSEPPQISEIKVVTDPVRAANLNLSAAQIGQTLRSLFEGIKVGEIEDKGSRYDIKLKMADFDSKSISSLSGLSIPNASGVPIPITNVADISVSKTASKIERYSGQRQIMLLANFKGKDLSKAVNQVEAELKKQLPEGVSFTFEGQAKMLKDTMKSVMTSLLLAILLVFMVLCAQFESYLTPFVIMMSVPLAFSGAFGALLITNTGMSIYGMIGLIMLMGLVTKNGILLIDFSLAQMRMGKNVYDALLIAGPARLRPILMTTAAMIFGMLPIAIGHGVGGEARAPMAICVIGGLISSTVLTLVVVPCVFSVIEGGRAFFSNRRSKKAGSHALDENAAIQN